MSPPLTENVETKTETSSESILLQETIGGVGMTTYLSDSIYLWACDDRITNPCDMAVGWVILLSQIAAYALLIMKEQTESDDDDEDVKSFSVMSVMAAMYVMVVFAAPDFLAGYILLVRGKVYQRIFGAALLFSVLLLFTASLTLLFSTSTSDTQLLIGSASVLFIADVDEKVVGFFDNMTPEWRLFWAIEAVGISFVLAIGGINLTGETGAITDEQQMELQFTGNHWYVFYVNPVATTALAWVGSSILQHHLSGSSYKWISDWIKKDLQLAGTVSTCVVIQLLTRIGILQTVVTLMITFAAWIILRIFCTVLTSTTSREAELMLAGWFVHTLLVFFYAELFVVLPSSASIALGVLFWGGYGLALVCYFARTVCSSQVSSVDDIVNNTTRRSSSWVAIRRMLFWMVVLEVYDMVIVWSKILIVTIRDNAIK